MYADNPTSESNQDKIKSDFEIIEKDGQSIAQLQQKSIGSMNKDLRLTQTLERDQSCPKVLPQSETDEHSPIIVHIDSFSKKKRQDSPVHFKEQQASPFSSSQQASVFILDQHGEKSAQAMKRLGSSGIIVRGKSLKGLIPHLQIDALQSRKESSQVNKTESSYFSVYNQGLQTNLNDIQKDIGSTQVVNFRTGQESLQTKSQNFSLLTQIKEAQIDETPLKQQNFKKPEQTQQSTTQNVQGIEYLRRIQNERNLNQSRQQAQFQIDQGSHIRFTDFQKRPSQLRIDKYQKPAADYDYVRKKMKTAQDTNQKRMVDQQKLRQAKKEMQDGENWQSTNYLKQGSFSFAQPVKTDKIKSTQVSTFHSPKESMVLTSPLCISTQEDQRFFLSRDPSNRVTNPKPNNIKMTMFEHLGSLEKQNLVSVAKLDQVPQLRKSYAENFKPGKRYNSKRDSVLSSTQKIVSPNDGWISFASNSNLLSPLAQIEKLKNLQRQKVNNYRNKQSKYRLKREGFSQSQNRNYRDDQSVFSSQPIFSKRLKRNYQNLDPRYKQKVIQDHLNELIQPSQQETKQENLDTSLNQECNDIDTFLDQQLMQTWVSPKQSAVMSPNNFDMPSNAFSPLSSFQNKSSTQAPFTKINKSKSTTAQSNLIQARKMKELRIEDQIKNFHHARVKAKKHLIDQKQCQMNQLIEQDMKEYRDVPQHHLFNQSFHVQSSMGSIHSPIRKSPTKSLGKYSPQRLSPQRSPQRSIQKSPYCSSRKSPGRSKAASSPYGRSRFSPKLSQGEFNSDQDCLIHGYYGASLSPANLSNSSSSQDNEEDEWFKIPKNVRKLYRIMEKELQKSLSKTHSKHIKKGRPSHHRRLINFLKVIDREFRDRQERKLRSKQSQLEFINWFRPTPDHPTGCTTEKIQRLKDEISKEFEKSDHLPKWFDLLNINLIQSKLEFKQQFQENDPAFEMALKDPEFKQQLNNATDETKLFVNKVLQEVRDQEKAKGILAFTNDIETWKQEAGIRFKKKQSSLLNVANYVGFDEDLERTDDKKPEITEGMSLLEELKATGKKVWKRRYTNDGILVRTLEDEQGIVEVESVKRMPKQKKITHRYMQVLNEAFPNIKLNMYLGYKYEMGLENGIYENEFILQSQVTARDKLQIKLNYKKPFYNLDNLDDLMSRTTHKQKFYKAFKFHQHLSQGNLYDKATREYFDECYENREVPQPSFVKIKQNSLFLVDEKVSSVKAQSLFTFLQGYTNNPQMMLKRLTKGIKNNPQVRIYHLSLVNCQIEDHDLAKIFKGIQHQGKLLASLTFSRNKLGPEGLKKICELIPFLNEIHLDDIKFHDNKNMIRTLISTLFSKGKSLMSIKISNINLNDEIIVDHICGIINQKLEKFVHHVELVACSLTAKNLCKIMTDIRYYHENIRHLNISYNPLSLHESQKGTEEYKHSKQFVDYLCEFIEDQYFLNFLNISGLNLGPNDIARICEKISISNFICSVHLNDNGINLTDDHQLLADNYLCKLYDLFGLDHQNKKESKNDQLVENKYVRNPELLLKIVQEQTGFVQTNQVDDHSKFVDVEHYKEHLIHGKQLSQVKEEEQVKQVMQNEGIGMKRHTNYDKFLVKRLFNFPELIFNQSENQDDYFNIHETSQWQIQNKDSACSISEKHKYTLIFYERPAKNLQKEANNDMIEIKDQYVLQQIKKCLHLTQNDVQDPNQPPFICGTTNSFGFTRKNKMMRADMFAILCISQTDFFFSHQSQSVSVRKGIWQVLEPHHIAQNCTMSEDENKTMMEKFKGWHKILNDKCKRNDIQDIFTVNYPQSIDQRTSPPPRSLYCFAGFLPPGLHSFLIFDPYLKKAFCKTMVVDHSKQYFFPDLPTSVFNKKAMTQDQIEKRQLTLRNFWRESKNSQDDWMNLVFFQERHSLVSPSTGQQYDPDQYENFPNMEKQEVDGCLNIIQQEFNTVVNCFSDLQSKCIQSYPLVNIQVILQMITNLKNGRFKEAIGITGNYKADNIYGEFLQEQLESLGIQVEQIESLKMSQKSKQKKSKSKKKSIDCDVQVSKRPCFINRAEFIGTLIKLCKIVNKVKNEQIEDTLSRFLVAYQQNVMPKTKLMQGRRRIRNSKELNQLLIDNQPLLQKVFQTLIQKHQILPQGKNQGFNLPLALDFVQQLKQFFSKKTFTKHKETLIFERLDEKFDDKIKELFILSKQVVKQNSNQHDNLEFLEFTEFMCRLGRLLYKSNYVKTYGIDRVEIKISKAESAFQIIDVAFLYMMDIDNQRVKELNKGKTKNERVQPEEFKIIEILQYDSDAGSTYEMPESDDQDNQ